MPDNGDTIGNLKVVYDEEHLMLRKSAVENVFKVAVLLGTSGMLVASSCNMQDARAVSAGIDAAAGYIDGQQVEDDDISFGDWIMDELDD